MKKLLLLLYFMFGIFHFAFSQTAPGIEWQKCLGGSDGQNAYGILKLPGKNYLAYGVSGPANNGNVTGCIGEFDCWFVKIDSIGNIIWQQCHGGSDYEYPLKGITTSDSNYLFVGFTNSNDFDVTGNHQYFHPNLQTWINSDDIWVVKIDTYGNILWQKCIGGSGGESASDVIQTSDGGYLIAGGTNSLDGDVTATRIDTIPYYYDGWLVKIDSVGNVLWNKCYGGNDGDVIKSILKTMNGYLLASYTTSIDGDVSGNHGTSDIWVAEIDTAGNIMWQKCFGGPDAENFFRMIPAPNGDFLISGSAGMDGGDVSGFHGGYYDVWVIRFDSIGNLIWQKCLGGSLIEYSHQIGMFPDGSILVSSVTQSNDGDVSGNHSATIYDTDVWLTKLDSNGYMLWQKCFGGSQTEYEADFIIDSSNAIIFAGMAGSNDFDVSGHHGGGDYWIVKLVPDTITGIPNVQSSTNNLQLFPNPAQNQITITLPPTFTQGPAVLTVFDMLGKQVLKQSISNQTSHILNLKSFPAGVYYMQVGSGMRMTTERFVKM